MAPKVYQKRKERKGESSKHPEPKKLTPVKKKAKTQATTSQPELQPGTEIPAKPHPTATQPDTTPTPTIQPVASEPFTDQIQPIPFPNLEATPDSVPTIPTDPQSEPTTAAIMQMIRELDEGIEGEEGDEHGEELNEENEVEEEGESEEENDGGLRVELGQLIWDNMAVLLKIRKGVSGLPFAGFITKYACKKGVVTELGEQVAKPLGPITASSRERSASHKKGKEGATLEQFMAKMHENWDEMRVTLGEVRNDQDCIKKELLRQGKRIEAIEAKLELLISSTTAGTSSLPSEDPPLDH